MTNLPSRYDAGLEYWLGRPVPRYTSYPAATSFQSAIGGIDYQKSLSNLAPQTPISLYLHIPFCRELCLYCGCNTGVTKSTHRIDSYIKSLQSEIRTVAKLIPTSAKVQSIHWGGGTPNILANNALKYLFELLKECFDLSACHEVAMELDPRQCSPEQIETLAYCGINRVSLGVQDFDKNVQELINRNQSLKLVECVYTELLKVGIKTINFDLMYGLPLQTIKSIEETARITCEFMPQRVALFSYAHVPQFKKHQRALESAGIINRHLRFEMDQTAREILTSAGYQEIGIDHFALPGDELLLAYENHTLHRSFQGYTSGTSKTLIGFGASSISKTSDGYFQNERETKTYQNSIAAKGLATMRGIILSEEDQFRADVIEELMCYMSCDVDAFCKKYKISMTSLNKVFLEIRKMEELGLVQRSGAHIQLLTPYRMAIRVLCQAFDSYGLANIISGAA